MYATHHKTGRQVRILNQSTSTWKDTKTLVWLDPRTIDTSIQWNRFDVGCVSVQHYNDLISKNIYPDVLVSISKEDVSWIRKNVKNVKIIFASNDILNELTEKFFQDYKVSNLLSLNELHLIYSFLENEWDGSINDACILVALVLRCSETFPLEKSSRNIYNLKVLDALKNPNQLWFFTQYYVPKEFNRRIELVKTLSKNVQNPFIDKIILLNESEVKYEKHDKITQIVIGKRLFYSDIYNYIYNEVPDNVTVVYANADIYLDTTIRNIWSVNIEDKFFALLRYENGEIYGPRPDSQDAWILSSNSVKTRSNNYKDLEFSFGVMGCDNAITLEMMRQKYLIVNPSLTIKTHHLHDSAIRNYVVDDIVEKDTYLYIEPTALNDMNAVTNITAHIEKKMEFTSFDRPVSCSNENKSKTFCTMISKQERYKYSMSKNTFIPLTANIYKFQNVFQTNTGLVYDYDKIYIGKSTTSKEAWAESAVSTLTASISTDIAYVSYIPDAFVKNVETYLLYYLSKVLLIKAVVQKDGEFWCMNEPSFVNVMRLFKWNQASMPLLSRTDSELTFAKEAYVLLPSDEKEVSKEQIEALRSFIRVYQSDEEDPVAVFVDGTYITNNFVEMLEKIYPNVNPIYPTTSVERKISYLQNASLTILSSSASSISSYGWLWCMKSGTKVYDIQNEMNMNGEILHLANASQLEYHFTTVPKGSLTNTLEERILNEIQQLDIKRDTLPVILVPNKVQGFFDHAGDSFREMIDLWEERGYIKKEYSSCKNVWLNSIGDTLLYDRPNYDWIKNAGPDEQIWKKGLFGNPKPLKGVAWSFWARRPRFVEEMLNNKFEKTKNVVFYGCTENQVQKNNRTKYDWSTCCDEYVMGEVPAFTQQEYLENLSKARYGLCLAGYGKKCHREVECMAFGCIPLVAPEVDMDSYANPPIEGLHYLRVSSPEDLLKKIGEMDDDVWWRMSEACKKWYLENCSVDGMWQLTKNLCNI